MVRVHGGVETFGADPPAGGREDPDELRLKILHLEAALETQRMIGTAVGLLAQRADCTTEDAWRQLVRLSQHANIKVREIARHLVDGQDARVQPPGADQPA